MASTYVNDLRLNELGTGDGSGTWGTTTNTNLELIAEGLSFGTEGITTNADTHTSTVADGATDPVRSMYVKYTGTLDSACTITIAPNTISRLHFIENGTSGSQNIIISQGSGANVTIPPGDVKVVYLDGAGSGAAVVDAFASLSVVDLKVQDDLTVTGDAAIGDDLLLNSDSAVLSIGADADLKITHDGTNGDFESAGNLTFDIAGDINLDADGGEVNFQDGGTTIAYLSNSRSDFLLGVSSSDKDLYIQGNDGGSTINALQLDMSAAGFAKFNAGGSFSGNLGIGTASPTAGFRASINGDGSSIIGGVEFRNASSGGSTFTIGHSSATSPSGTINVVESGNLIFKTDDTEVARMDSTGGLRVGVNSHIFNGAQFEQASIKNPGNGNAATFEMTNQTGGFPILYVYTSDQTSTQNAIIFQRHASVAGSITTTNTSVAYNTSSDYRLKTAVEYNWDATSRLKQLKPARFKWIADGDDAVEVDGFLAHEAATVVPEAVSGTKDETRDVENAVLSSTGFVLHRGIAEADWTAGKLATTDDDGNSVDALYPSDSTWAASHTEDVMQGIDQAKLVPLLVKTILELEARITALESA